MKKAGILALFGLVVFALPLAAQDEGGTKPLNAMGFNGTTGLYVVPTARVGFSDAAFGFNGGYHTNIFKPTGGGAELNHLIKANFSLLRTVELFAALDFQPDTVRGKDPHDFLTGLKIQIPLAVPIALGGNFQWRDMGRSNVDHWAFQVYLAVTYGAKFFSWPASTTLMVGHTFVENHNEGNVDFGMGFDLVLLPKYLGDFLHLVIDFANFSYSADPWGADAWTRGVLNAGIRVDLSQIPALGKFTFAIDFLVADAFDDKNYTGQGRSIGMGGTFGIRL
ncbi:MAG: hypothetical protein LBG84_03210 [Treponema sp.]|jgi:hypothetical protein|nr:hypothetical protein [Treponema sp.]